MKGTVCCDGLPNSTTFQVFTAGFFMLFWHELISVAPWEVGNQYLENVEQQCNVEGSQFTLSGSASDEPASANL